MPWKFIEKIKDNLLNVPYDLFRFFTGFITIAYIIVFFKSPTESLQFIWLPLFFCGLLFLFKKAGKKIKVKASDEYYYASNRKVLPQQIENDIFSYLSSCTQLPMRIVVTSKRINVGTKDFIFYNYSYKDISNTEDLAGVAYQLQDVVYSRFNHRYNIKPWYTTSSDSENDIIGYTLFTEPTLHDW